MFWLGNPLAILKLLSYSFDCFSLANSLLYLTFKVKDDEMKNLCFQAHERKSILNKKLVFSNPLEEWNIIFRLNFILTWFHSLMCAKAWTQRVEQKIVLMIYVESAHLTTQKADFNLFFHCPFSELAWGEHERNCPAHITICAILMCPCVSPTCTGNK